MFNYTKQLVEPSTTADNEHNVRQRVDGSNVRQPFDLFSMTFQASGPDSQTLS